MKDCTRCKGQGVTHHKAFTYTDSVTGRVSSYPDRTDKCYACDGAGHFLPPNESALRAAIKGRKSLRSAKPVTCDGDRADRAYYVWRMARFHGGVDVTMPITASCGVSGDPYRDDLDVIADKVSREYFGTDLAAAHRWGRALGYVTRDMPGLPATAYESGPVLTAEKPEEELPELM